MSTEKLTPERIIEALRNAGGILALAARQLNCSRQAIYKAMKRHPELVRARDEIVEETLDLAEAALLGLIRDSDPSSVRFYLSTKGKHRGYSTRQEVTGADGEPLSKPKLDLSAYTTDELRQLRAIHLAALERAGASPSPSRAHWHHPADEGAQAA